VVQSASIQRLHSSEPDISDIDELLMPHLPQYPQFAAAFSLSGGKQIIKYHQIID
jgi:hypothetical protein